MLTNRQLKIIAEDVLIEASKRKTAGGKKAYLDNMELMVMRLGGDIHQYREEVQKRQPQMQMRM